MTRPHDQTIPISCYSLVHFSILFVSICKKKTKTLKVYGDYLQFKAVVLSRDCFSFLRGSTRSDFLDFWLCKS